MKTDVLNITPIVILRGGNEETIAFADIIFGGKTKKILEKTKKVVSVAFKYTPPVGVCDFAKDKG